MAKLFALFQDGLYLPRQPYVREADVDEAGMGYLHRAKVVRAFHTGDYFFCNLDRGHSRQASHAQADRRGVVAVALIFGALQDHLRQVEFGQVALLLCFFDGVFDKLDDVVADQLSPLHINR